MPSPAQGRLPQSPRPWTSMTMLGHSIRSTRTAQNANEAADQRTSARAHNAIKSSASKPECKPSRSLCGADSTRRTADLPSLERPVRGSVRSSVFLTWREVPAVSTNPSVTLRSVARCAGVRSCKVAPGGEATSSAPSAAAVVDLRRPRRPAAHGAVRGARWRQPMGIMGCGATTRVAIGAGRDCMRR